MKNKLGTGSLLLLFLFLFSACNSVDNANADNGVYGDGGSTQTSVASNVGTGLDLQALASLAKTTKTPQELEEKLNQPNSINNLDLDSDGNVDYLTVSEYGSGDQKGFSVVDQLPNGQNQEVANIEVDRDQSNPNNGTVYVNGNDYVYGPNIHYQYDYTMADMLLFSYLFMPHPVYVSPWHWGYYPAYYHPYVIVSGPVYMRSVRTYRTVPFRRVYNPPLRTRSPYAGARSPYVRRTYAAPVRSQRSFGVRPAGPARSGGFGHSSPAPRTYTPRTNSSGSFHTAPRSSGGGGFGRGGSSRGGGFGRRR